MESGIRNLKLSYETRQYFSSNMSNVHVKLAKLRPSWDTTGISIPYLHFNYRCVVFCTLPYINKLSFLWTHPDFRVRHDEDTPRDDGCKRQIEYKI